MIFSCYLPASVLFQTHRIAALSSGAMVVLIILGVSLLVIGAGALAVRHFARKANEMSGKLFGASLSGVADMVKEGAEQRRERPRSLNGMESIYGPQIARDYPDLRVEALAGQSETILLQSYEALDKGMTSKNTNDFGSLYSACLDRLIAQHRSLGSQAAKFDQLLVHDRVLSGYRWRDGKREIEFQFALEALVSSIDKPNPVKVQMRPTLSWLFLDDAKKFSDLGAEKDSLSLHCPNCGAPIRASDKSCAYCHAGITRVQLQNWVPAELKPELWLNAWRGVY